MKAIDFTSSFKAIDDYVKECNKDLKKGEPGFINASKMAIMKEITRLWGHQIRKFNKQLGLGPGRPSAVQLAYFENTPPCKTNSVELGDKLNMSPRTIRRHIKELLDNDQFLLGKDFHGHKLDYVLWIDPKIVEVKGCDVDVYKEVDSARKSAAEATIMEKIPADMTAAEFAYFSAQKALEKLTQSSQANVGKKAGKTRALKNIPTAKMASTSTTVRTSSNYLNDNYGESQDESSPTVPAHPLASSDVSPVQALPSQLESKKLGSPEPQGEGLTPGAGAPGRAATLGSRVASKMGVSRENDPESTRVASQGVSSTKNEDVALPFRGGALLDSAQVHAKLLHRLAVKLLYPNEILSDYEIENMQEILLNYFAAARSKAEIQRWHQDYCQRIEMAAKYARRHHFLVPRPTLYFDLRNEKGFFLATKRWMEKKKKDALYRQMEIFTKKMLITYNNNPSEEMKAACLTQLDEHVTEFYVNRFNWYIANGITNDKLNFKH